MEPTHGTKFMHEDGKVKRSLGFLQATWGFYKEHLGMVSLSGINIQFHIYIYLFMEAFQKEISPSVKHYRQSLSLPPYVDYKKCLGAGKCCLITFFFWSVLMNQNNIPTCGSGAATIHN